MATAAPNRGIYAYLFNAGTQAQVAVTPPPTSALPGAVITQYQYWTRACLSHAATAPFVGFFQIAFNVGSPTTYHLDDASLTVA